MKKTLLVGASFALMLSLVAGCSKESTNTPTPNEGGTTKPAETKTVKLFNFKVEISESLNKLKESFEKDNPGIKLEIETLGGGADYSAQAKAKLAANDLPDIMVNGGNADLDVWVEHLEDLSSEPWAKDIVDVARPGITKDGKLYGQPMALEGYGFIYNKELFEKAGITATPKTLTELKAAADKLKAANITPFVNAFGEWWVMGIHNVNMAFAHQPDPDAFIKGLNDGSQKIKGNKAFDEWVKLLDLTNEYGQKNAITTDYNTSVASFAKGEAAMIQQGNWVTNDIQKVKPDIKMGFIPMAISDDAAAMDKLAVGVPNYWVVTKNSKVKDEAKKFLNYLVSSDAGKNTIVNEFKFIPALKSIEVKDYSKLGPLAEDLVKYANANKTLTFNWFKFPGTDATSHGIADAMQAYISKQTNKDQMLDAFQKAWDTNNKK